MSSDCISTENKYSAGAGVVVEIVLVLVLPVHVLVLVVWLYCCTVALVNLFLVETKGPLTFFG